MAKKAAGIIITVFLLVITSVSAGAISQIEMISITITAPVDNAAPNSTASVPTGEMRYTVDSSMWTPNPTAFKEGETYLMMIVLRAEPGFTFFGIENTSVTINGQSVTIAMNSGSILVMNSVFTAIAEPDEPEPGIGGNACCNENLPRLFMQQNEILVVIVVSLGFLSGIQLFRQFRK